MKFDCLLKGIQVKSERKVRVLHVKDILGLNWGTVKGDRMKMDHGKSSPIKLELIRKEVTVHNVFVHNVLNGFE